MMALCRFYLWSNQGMIMLSTCASSTILIYWSLSDYYSIEKQHIRPLGNIAHHHVGENCRFAAESLHGWMTTQMATRLTLRVQTHKRAKSLLFQTTLWLKEVLETLQAILSRGHTNYDIQIIVVTLKVTTIFFQLQPWIIERIALIFLGSHMPNINYEVIVCSASVVLTQ